MTAHDAGGLVVSNVTVADHKLLRRLVLLGTPLALALLEFFHPEQPSGAKGGPPKHFHVEEDEWFSASPGNTSSRSAPNAMN